MVAVAALLALPAGGQSQAPATPVTKPAYSAAQTNLGALLGDSAARAVVAKHLPALLTKEWLDQAGDMTLEQLVLWAPEMVNEKVLADIDVELAKLPRK